jgi:hypothetical protein
MTIELGCPGCGRTLRVAEEHAGKQIRCPACQQISLAPQIAEKNSLAAAATDESAEQATTWHVRTPEGAVYGPIAWNELVSWAAEGRVAADCEVSQSREGPWRDAAELLDVRPVPGAANVQQQPAMYPWSGAAASGQAAPQPAPQPFTPSGGYVAPHRGPLILVLGLLGFMSCPVFSLIAWIMGGHDLREMRAGRMDRRGEGLTLAGMVLGMILSLLWIFIIVIFLIIILIFFAANL